MLSSPDFRAVIGLGRDADPIHAERQAFSRET